MLFVVCCLLFVVVVVVVVVLYYLQHSHAIRFVAAPGYIAHTRKSSRSNSLKHCQCPITGDKCKSCSLWTNAAEDDKLAVMEAKKRAEEEVVAQGSLCVCVCVCVHMICM